MTAARIRISRVRMKNGGADVRVITPQRLPDGHVMNEFRKFQRDVLGSEVPPNAMCAVALWIRPEHPAYPTVACSYASDTAAITTAVLPELLARYARQRITTWQAECQTMEALGYNVEDDPESA